MKAGHLRWGFFNLLLGSHTVQDTSWRPHKPMVQQNIAYQYLQIILFCVLNILEDEAPKTSNTSLLVGNKHNNQWLPSFHLFPLNMKCWFPLRKHHITLQRIVMWHIWKDKTVISVLGQTFKTMHFQVWEFWYSYLKWEDCKDRLSQLILKCKDGSISILFFLFDSDFRGQRKRLSTSKFQISVLARIVLVLGPLHFLVYDLSRFIKGALQLWLFVQPISRLLISGHD